MPFRITPTQVRTLNTLSKMTTYNIQITSDIVCPWCYIGALRLNSAITNHKKLYPNDTFTQTYIPFYLNPPSPSTKSQPSFPLPIPPRPRREVYDAKFGVARTSKIFDMLASVAEKEGLSFKFGGMTGSSRNGHRLVHFAQERGGDEKAKDVMMGLWRRYFEEEVDITALDVLVEVGVEAGVSDEEEVREFLLSGKGAEVVDSLAEKAAEEGVSGVPSYVLQGKWVVGGAQEAEVFEQLFRKIKSLETGAAGGVAEVREVNVC